MGAGICAHGRQKGKCADCNDFTCDFPECLLAGHRFAGAQELLRHMRRAHAEHPKALTKQKEFAVHTLLTKAG
eukprot:2509865-Alexandrium_andersonii.AAC.1